MYDLIQKYFFSLLASRYLTPFAGLVIFRFRAALFAYSFKRWIPSALC